MKKVIFAIIIILLFGANFSFAWPSDLPIPDIFPPITSGLWELEIANRPSKAVHGAEKIIIEVKMESYKLSGLIPAIAYVAEIGDLPTLLPTNLEGLAGYMDPVSEKVVCVPGGPFTDPVTDQQYYQGTCTHFMSFVVNDEGVDPRGGEKDYVVMLYRGNEMSTIMQTPTEQAFISSTPFSITVIPFKKNTTDNETPEDRLNVLQTKEILELAERIINIIFGIIVSFAFIAILLGGFLMITSAGDPTRLSKARNTIFFALAGFALASLSKGIVALIQAIMGVK
ncbi:MAG: hypothetical protein WC309_03630 [Candidatus Paceibacterota bacterium]|jgi:hypothetical protein